jgi:hypothetical protein
MRCLNDQCRCMQDHLCTVNDADCEDRISVPSEHGADAGTPVSGPSLGSRRSCGVGQGAGLTGKPPVRAALSGANEGL